MTHGGDCDIICFGVRIPRVCPFPLGHDIDLCIRSLNERLEMRKIYLAKTKYSTIFTDKYQHISLPCLYRYTTLRWDIYNNSWYEAYTVCFIITLLSALNYITWTSFMKSWWVVLKSIWLGLSLSQSAVRYCKSGYTSTPRYMHVLFASFSIYNIGKYQDTDNLFPSMLQHTTQLFLLSTFNTRLQK